VDAVALGHHIIDYKTSASGPQNAMTIKKTFVNVDDKPDYAPQDFQFPLYLLAARSIGLNPVKLMYYWLAQEDAAAMFKMSSLDVGDDKPESLTSADIERVTETILEIVGKIHGGEFAASPKTRYECSRCAFEFICDSYGEDTVENEW
jgi:hypothetical protein